MIRTPLALAAALCLPALAGAQSNSAGALPPVYLGTNLELEQSAWRDPSAHIGAGQRTPGHRICRHDGASVCAVRTRYGLSTTIRLAPTEQITIASLSDTGAYEAALYEHGPQNVIEVRPLAAGVDATLKLHTHGGTLYLVYLSSGDHKESTITDIIVDITRPGDAITGAPTMRAAQASSATHAPAAHGPTTHAATTVSNETLALAQQPPSAQFAALTSSNTEKGIYSLYGNLGIEGFDPAHLRYDLDAYANTPEAARVIGPKRVWRDERWTFIDFGNKAEVRERWPVAFLLTDDTEAPVRTRTAGAHRQILIVEAIGDIVLRSGAMVICLRMRRAPGGAPAEIAVPSSTPTVIATPVDQTGQPGPNERRADLIITTDQHTTEAQRVVINRILSTEVPYAVPDNGTVRGVALVHAQRACIQMARIGIACQIQARDAP